MSIFASNRFVNHYMARHSSGAPAALARQCARSRDSLHWTMSPSSLALRARAGDEDRYFAAHAHLACNQAGGASILDHRGHQISLNARSTIGVTIDERAITIKIDQPRDAAAVLMGEPDGFSTEQAQ